jgi:hypothetical protein
MFLSNFSPQIRKQKKSQTMNWAALKDIYLALGTPLSKYYNLKLSVKICLKMKIFRRRKSKKNQQKMVSDMRNEHVPFKLILFDKLLTEN